MSPPEILLFDIMSTVVRDPFYDAIPDHFGVDLETLVENKHPTAWMAFERGEIDESTFCEVYFEDSRPIDREALRETLREAYRFLDGMEELLDDLAAAGCELHAFSNYPIWYRIIEDELHLRRFLEWSFVSWETGRRKPTDGAYRNVLETLDVPAEACLFVDDRPENCAAAREHGIRAIPFEGADRLREELVARSVTL